MYFKKKEKYQERTKKLIRSSNYRELYFKTNRGIQLPTKPSKALYFCPYCGKPMINKKKMVVDHIYSIRRVQTKKRLRVHFKQFPDGVNNISNLVACCAYCNKRKGKKGGLWVFAR